MHFVTQPKSPAPDTPPELEFTGERFTPECVREIWYEHFHRYALATRVCGGKRVLDAACGEGYGSALLASHAASVTGVDIESTVIEHASERYQGRQNLEFLSASVTDLPFADNSFDAIVSFETLEHLEEQSQMLGEFRRVLRDEGFLLISSPDKAIYSEEQGAENPYHVRELYQQELEDLIREQFSHYRLLGQRLQFFSTIWALDSPSTVEVQRWDDSRLDHGPGVLPRPMYFLALCANSAQALPGLDAGLWLFSDQQQSVYQHYHGEIRRNMAAGGIIAERDQEIARLTAELEKATAPVPWYRRLLGKG